MGTEMKEEKKGKVGILKFWTWNFRTMSAGIQAVLIGLYRILLHGCFRIKCSLSCNTAHGIQDL